MTEEDGNREERRRNEAYRRAEWEQRIEADLELIRTEMKHQKGLLRVLQLTQANLEHELAEIRAGKGGNDGSKAG